MIIPDRFLHVFHWPGHHPIRLLLPGMILVSLLIHAAGLYLVRAASPVRGVSLAPFPAKLAVFPVGGESALLAARDPSWIEPGRFRGRLLPVPRATRPWRAMETALPPLVLAPGVESSGQWAPPIPPLAGNAWLERGTGRTPPPVLNPVTARFVNPGPEVTGDALARLRASAPAEPPGLPTEMLVVLDASGEARHVWLVRSSGVPALDLAAQLAVRRSRFGISERGFRGILRVVWGGRQASP